MLPHGPDVGRRHVRGQRFDLGSGPLQSLPEGIQRVRALAVSQEHHGSALRVQDHRQVPMAAPDADLIDGNPFGITKPGPPETTLQFRLQDRLHHVPAHVQVSGNAPDRQAPGELQRIPGTPLRVPMVIRCEPNLRLANRRTRLASKSPHRQLDPHSSSANREPSKASMLSPFPGHVSAPTGRAPGLLVRLTDGEVDLAAHILGPPVDGAMNAKGVVQ